MFQNNKTEKKVMEISNFLHILWNFELPENRVKTDKVFLMKTMVITNAPFSSPRFSQSFIHIALLFFLFFFFIASGKTEVLFNIMLCNIFSLSLSLYLSLSLIPFSTFFSYIYFVNCNYCSRAFNFMNFLSRICA